MKKINKILFCLVTIVMLLPMMVFAKDDIEIDFDGVQYAKPGDIVAYDIKMEVADTVTVTGFKANIEYDSTILEYQDAVVKQDSGWKKEKNDTTNLYFSVEDGINGTTTVATVSFKIKGSAKKQTTKIILKDIEVITVDEAGDPGYKHISDTEEEQLSIKSTDNTLKDLKVDGMTLEDFKSDVTDYKFIVDSDVDKIDVKATLNDTTATFVEEYNSREVELEYGENEVLIKTKSESGDIKVYKIIITREDDRNTNNNLKEVIINSGKIKLKLSKSKVDYTVKTYKLKELDVEAIPVDPKATVEVEIPSEIVVGENIVVIKVISETGEEKLYSITFENSDTSIDTKLKTLYVKGFDIDFDKNTMVYEIVYNRFHRRGLEIKPVTVSGDDLVEYVIYYNGTKLEEVDNLQLKIGDKYEIQVHPLGMEEGDESETSTYTITIVKDTRISFYLLLEILIAIILSILITIQIFKKRKNDRIRQSRKEKKNNKLSNTKVEEEVNKTKVIDTDEMNKMN